MLNSANGCKYQGLQFALTLFRIDSRELRNLPPRIHSTLNVNIIWSLKTLTEIVKNLGLILRTILCNDTIFTS